MCSPFLILLGCTDTDQPSLRTSDAIAATEGINRLDKEVKSHVHVDFPDIRTFQPSYLETAGEPYCYKSRIRFRASDTELVIYPIARGASIDAAQAAELRKQFDRFQDAVDVALIELPPKLRTLCDEYEIDVRRVADVEMINNIRWHNVKLQPDGTIECYTSNRLVTESLDIVLGFSADLRLDYVYFDG